MKLKFNYRNITSEGCEGWLNLFFGEVVIAMISSPIIAEQIRLEHDERTGYNIDAEEKQLSDNWRDYL